MRYALVTGAAGGMGSRTVEALIKEGYHVLALDKSPVDSCRQVTWLEADLTDENSISAACQRAKGVTQRLDAIVHFGGIYMLDSLVEMETADFDRIMDINFRGVYLVNRIFLPLLGENSRILITTSELAPLSPLPFTGIYAVAKSALDKYAYSLRMELQLLQIHVSVLRAGAVDTGMLAVSTAALDRFCEKTKLYRCNARRFKRIVEGVEARNIPPQKLAQKAVGILKKKNPAFAYSINRNGLLLLLDMLPQRLQFWIIGKILK